MKIERSLIGPRLSLGQRLYFDEKLGASLCGQLEILFPELREVPCDTRMPVVISDQPFDGAVELHIDDMGRIPAEGVPSGLVVPFLYLDIMQVRLLFGKHRTPGAIVTPCVRWISIKVPERVVSEKVRRVPMFKGDYRYLSASGSDPYMLEMCRDLEIIFPNLRDCALGFRFDLLVRKHEAKGFYRVEVSGNGSGRVDIPILDYSSCLIREDLALMGAETTEEGLIAPCTRWLGIDMKVMRRSEAAKKAAETRRKNAMTK